jgi:hypothetical protein
LESEVFLLGHWKNFDELESNLSLEELMALIEFSRNKDYKEKKFVAAVNGVDIDEDSEESTSRTSDILINQGQHASDEGFGINEGLGHMQLGE